MADSSTVTAPLWLRAAAHTLSVRWQRRQLASDQRAGIAARGRARRAQRAFARRNWRLLLLTALGMTAPTLLVLPLLPAGFLRGLLLGSALTATAGLLAFTVVQATGTAATLMGDTAEQWTASELRRLHRAGCTT